MPISSKTTTRCLSCTKYRKNMNAMAKKDAEKADNIGIKRLSIHTNYRYISKHQMVNEIIVLRKQQKEKERNK
jgi:hypothetical protein